MDKPEQNNILLFSFSFYNDSMKNPGINLPGKKSTIKQTNLVYSLDPTRCDLVIEPRMLGEPLTVSLIDSMRVDDNDAAFAFLRRNTPRHGGVRATYTDSDITLFGMLLTNYNLWLQNNA